jgi:hypothetical protein
MGRFARSESRAKIRICYGYWAQLPTSSPGEYCDFGKLAEGEELGSNLLRVAQSSLWGPSGHLGCRSPLVRPILPFHPGQTDRGEWLKRSGSRHGAGRPSGPYHPGTNLRHPYQAHAEPPDWPTRRDRFEVRRGDQAPPSKPPTRTPFASDPRPFELEATPADPPSSEWHLAPGLNAEPIRPDGGRRVRIDLKSSF